MAVYQSPGVYVKELPGGSKPIEGVGTAIAAFIGMTEKGPTGVATMISNWGDYSRTFGGFVPGYATPLSIYGYFDNGGGRAYVVRVNSDSSVPAPQALLPGANPALKSLRARAVDPSSQVSVDIGPASEPTEETFKLTVHGPGGANEEYDNVTLKKGKGNVLTEVKARSKLITLEEVSTEGSLVERRPADGSYSFAAADAAPADVETSAFAGDVADRTGVAGLEAIEEVTMVLAPDVMPMQAMGAISMDQALGIQLALVSHAERMADRVAILDSPPGLGAQEVFDWRRDQLKVDSSYAALYYPWVKVIDPLSRQPVFMPPSGYLAGIWGRNDDTRGVHKAPANESVRGALDVQLQLDQRRAGPPEPGRHQLHPGLPARRRPGVGRAHARPDRSRVQVPQRAPSLQLHQELDHAGHPVVGLRAERPDPVGQAAPQHLGVPQPGLARRGALRRDPRRGVLCQVRLGDEPTRGDRSRPGRRRDRSCAGPARRVRHLQHPPDRARRGRRRRRSLTPARVPHVT